MDPNGNIVLEEGENIRLTFLYVANSDEGTVSKINTETGREEGRYISALYSPDSRNRGNASATGNAPSPTAVDFNGDVWVANRAFNQQGTVTKIAQDTKVAQMNLISQFSLKIVATVKCGTWFWSNANR